MTMQKTDGEAQIQNYVNHEDLIFSRKYKTLSDVKSACSSIEIKSFADALEDKGTAFRDICITNILPRIV